MKLTHILLTSVVAFSLSAPRPTAAQSAPAGWQSRRTSDGREIFTPSRTAAGEDTAVIYYPRTSLGDRRLERYLAAFVACDLPWTGSIAGCASTVGNRWLLVSMHIDSTAEGDGEPRSVRACQVDSRIRMFAPHSGVAAQHLEHVAPGVVRRHVRMVPVASGRHDAASKRSALRVLGAIVDVAGGAERPSVLLDGTALSVR